MGETPDIQLEDSSQTTDLQDGSPPPTALTEPLLEPASQDGSSTDLEPEVLRTGINDPIEQEVPVEPSSTLIDPNGGEWEDLGTTESGMHRIQSPDGRHTRHVDQETYGQLQEKKSASGVGETNMDLEALPATEPEADSATAEQQSPPESEVTAGEGEPDPSEPEPESQTENTPADAEQQADSENLEKLRDQNIDPRVVLRLKQNLIERLQAINGADESTRKVLAIREVSKHLRYQGIETADNGDFVPEGMKMLHAMITMMDLPDWALERLASNRVGDKEPLTVQPNDEELIDFIKETNEQNRAHVDGKAKDWWAWQQGDLPKSIMAEKFQNSVTKSFERAKRLVDDKWYLRTAAKAASYSYNRGRSVVRVGDENIDKFLNSLINGELARKRRAVIGWAAGTLATAGAGYMGIDPLIMSGERLADEVVATVPEAVLPAPIVENSLSPVVGPSRDVEQDKGNIPTPPSRVERFGFSLEGYSLKARRIAEVLRKIEGKLQL